MARPIQHEVRAPQIEPGAREELDRLLEICHEHGVLRFAGDLVAANLEITQVLAGGLEKEGVLNAIQNLSILAMALSRIPPSEFYRGVFAAVEGLNAISKPLDDEAAGAPGLSGVYRALNDDRLWSRIAPFLRALATTADALKQPVETPISAFSGKPRRTG